MHLSKTNISRSQRRIARHFRKKKYSSKGGWYLVDKPPICPPSHRLHSPMVVERWRVDIGNSSGHDDMSLTISSDAAQAVCVVGGGGERLFFFFAGSLARLAACGQPVIAWLGIHYRALQRTSQRVWCAWWLLLHHLTLTYSTRNRRPGALGCRTVR